MRPSQLTERIEGEGARAWATHAKARVREAAGEDIIILSIGDPDFETPTPIIEAAYQALKDGYTHYADLTGRKELREAIARYQGRSSGVAIDPDDVVALAGAQCGLFAAALLTLDPGDEAISPSPTYVTYEAVVGAPGAKLITVPTDPEQNFVPHAEDIAAAITPKTRAIMLASPNNPSGAMVPREQLREIGNLAREHDLWLISDQVYASLVFEGENTCPLTFADLRERTIVINSLSKSHAMTGWRIGWMIVPEQLRQPARNLMLAMLYGLPSFTQQAAITALDSELQELKDMKHAFAARRTTMVEELSKANNLICRTPPAGMFCMVDVRDTGLTSYEFAERLLDAEGVSTLPGDAFGPSGAGHLRVSLMVPEERLREACRRMVGFAQSL